MKSIKLVGALAAIFFASAVLSSCASLGTVTYQGNVKGLPVVVVVGGGK